VPIAVHAWLERRARPLDLALGGALPFVALAAMLAWKLPGAAFVCAFPAIGACAAATLRARFTDPESTGAGATALDALVPLAAIATLAPAIAIFFVVFGLDAAVPASVVIACAVSLGAPAVRPLLAPNRRALTTGAVGAALACIIAGRMTPPFDASSPKPDTLFYACDADAKRAYWVTAEEPDAWEANVASGATRGALPNDFFAAKTGDLFAKDAPFAIDDDTRVEIAKDDRESARTLDVRVVPPRGAELVMVQIAAGEIAKVAVQGEPLTVRSTQPFTFYYYAPPADGFVVSLGGVAHAARVRVVSQQPGLPKELAAPLGPRPAWLMPKPGMLPPWDELMESDMTVVARTVNL
jgi:hypothetical protein